MRGEDKQVELLVTDGEREAKLDALLGERFTERGNIYVPNAQQYNSLETSEGQNEVAKSIFRWLGVKPHRLSVSFSNLTGKDDTPTQSTILIPVQYRGHPYMIGAHLVLEVLSYVIEQKDEEKPDAAFIEYASIYTGLGLWVLNALKPRLSHFELVHHMIDGAWFKKEGLLLSNYTPEQYGVNVATYTHNNRNLAEDYLPGVSQHNRHLLPPHITSKSTKHLVEPQANYLHKKAATKMWVKIALIALTVATLITFGLFLWAQRTHPITAEQIQQEQAIKIIKNAFDACQQQVSDQLSDYDPNDIFLNRQVDATKVRCESLRNQYNYAVDQFEILYKPN